MSAIGAMERAYGWPTSGRPTSGMIVTSRNASEVFFAQYCAPSMLLAFKFCRTLH